MFWGAKLLISSVTAGGVIGGGYILGNSLGIFNSDSSKKEDIISTAHEGIPTAIPSKAVSSELLSEYMMINSSEHEEKEVCFKQERKGNAEFLENIKVKCDSDWNKENIKEKQEAILVRIKEEINVNNVLSSLELSKRYADLTGDKEWKTRGRDWSKPFFICKLDDQKESRIEIRCVREEQNIIT